MQTGVFLPTHCGKSKAMPKISTNLSECRNWGVMFLGSPLACSSCTRSTQMGISESNPSGSANWLRQGEPLHERITAAPPNSGSMRFTGSYFIEFTAQKTWEKTVTMTQSKDNLLGRRWENKKKTSNQHEMQKQRRPHPCHTAEALGIGPPKWSAGQCRESHSVNASGQQWQIPQLRPSQRFFLCWSGSSLQWAIRVPLLPNSTPLVTHKSCSLELPPRPHPGLKLVKLMLVSQLSQDLERGEQYTWILSSSEDTVLFCPFLGKFSRALEDKWPEYQLTRTMSHKEIALPK